MNIESIDNLPKFQIKEGSAEVLEQSRLSTIIITGPNGVGKGTISNLILRDSSLKIERFVRHTTRTQGPNEINSVDYHFVSKAEFDKMKSEDEFIHTIDKSFGSYGESRKKFLDAKQKGNLLLFELAFDSAEGLTAALNEEGIPSTTFFVTPTDILSGDDQIDLGVEILRNRMNKRGRGENLEELAVRLDAARTWLSSPPSDAHVVINRDGEEEFAAYQIRQKLREQINLNYGAH